MFNLLDLGFENQMFHSKYTKVNNTVYSISMSFYKNIDAYFTT